MSQSSKPQQFIKFSESIQASINTVKKYSLTYDVDSVRFIQNDQIQHTLILNVDSFMDLGDFVISFFDEVIVELERLMNEKCHSVGLNY